VQIKKINFLDQDFQKSYNITVRQKRRQLRLTHYRTALLTI